MQIIKNGTAPRRPGPPEYFIGEVSAEMLLAAPDPSRLQVAVVTFEPVARTAWHTHPLGQTLLVTAGTGLVQLWGEPARVIQPGDCVWIAPGEKHWHGASATGTMTHVAMHEQLDGEYADWMEQVSDDDYAAAQSAIG